MKPTRKFKMTKAYYRLLLTMIIGLALSLNFGFIISKEFMELTGEKETQRAVTHVENRLSGIHEYLLLLDANITTYNNEFNHMEFTELISGLEVEEHKNLTVFYAPKGIIENVYPFNNGVELLGTDVIGTFSFEERNEFYDVSKQNKVYLDTHKDDYIDITFYKAIYIEDEFHGVAGVMINDMYLAQIAEDFESKQYDINFFVDEETVFYGSYETESMQGISKADDIGGMELYVSLIPNDQVILLRFMLMFGFIILILAFFGFSGYHALKESLKREDLIRKLDYNNNYDSQTGLLNSNRMYRDGQSLIQENTPFFFAFGNFNNLKYIFDKFGHTKALEIVKHSAQLISRVLPEKVTFYRYGGDEYALIFRNTSKSEVINITKKIVALFEHELVYEKTHANISVSFGISSYPQDGKTFEQIIKNAHFTLSRTKSFSRNSFDFYRIQNDSKLVADHDYDTFLSNLSLDRFETQLMPVVEVKTEKIVGFECLSRISDEYGEPINIYDVIVSFERNGRIQELDIQVFKNMVSIKQILDRKYQRDIFLSANVSALSFNDDFVNEVIEIYQNASLTYKTIILELTESYKVDDYDYLIKLFKKLNKAGIRIAIDDFGSGYSSLNYISKFPLYAIKIDKAFVRDYDTNEFNRTLLLTLKSIAKVIDCKLVAEGVDEYETLQFLEEHDCEYYQGFLFSKVIPFARAIELLDENKTNKE